MVERNVYLLVVPVIVALLIIGIVIFEYLVKNQYFNLKPDGVTVFVSSLVLIGIACIAISLILFANKQEKIVKKAYVNALILLGVDKGIREKINELDFTIKRPRIWQENEIEYKGTKFIFSVENVLGSSKIGYNTFFLFYPKEPIKFEDVNGDGTQTQTKKNISEQIELEGAEFFFKIDRFFIRLPIKHQLKRKHMINALDYLKEKL